MSTPITLEQFKKDRQERLDKESSYHTHTLANVFMDYSVREKYFYNWEFMGVPVIQYPQDLMQIQEIIWNTKPSVIIETGLAWGGLHLFMANCLNLLGPTERERLVNIIYGNRGIFSVEKHIISGVEETIRDGMKLFIHCGSKLIESDSTEYGIENKFPGSFKTMVVLDSKHTKDHVLKELEIYAPLVSVGCYLVVCDTFVENRDPELYLNHECKPGNSPFDAVHEFLKNNDNFVIDTEIDRKLLISSNYNGYLKRVK